MLPFMLRWVSITALSSLVALMTVPTLVLGEERIVVWTGDGGTPQWSLAANWDPAGVPFNDQVNSIFYQVEIHSGTGVQISGINPTIDSLSLSNSLLIAQGSTLTVFRADDRLLSGRIVNSGQIDIDSVGAVTQLRLSSGDVVVTGGGVIQLGNNLLNRISGFDGAKLINEDNTIQGSGQVGFGSLGIVNRGVIIANQSVAMTVSPSALGAVNEGLIRATNGATLNLSHPIAATFVNELGIVEADDASTINLSGVTIGGGTMRAIGTGVYRVSGATLLDASNGMVLDGQLEVANGQTLFLQGNLNHSSGTLELQSTGATTSLHLLGQVELRGNADIVLTDATSTRILGSGVDPALINYNTIHGTGQLGNNSMQIVNHGVVQGDTTSGLTVDPNLLGLENAADGVLRSSNGGVLTLTSGTFTNRGLIEADAGSRIAVEDSALIVNDGGSIRIGQGGEIESAGVVELVSGKLEMDGGQLVAHQGVTLSSAQILGSGTLIGAVELGANSLIAPGNSPGILVFDGPLTLAGEMQFEFGGLQVDGSLPSEFIVNTGIDPLLTEIDQIHVLDQLRLLDGARINLELLAGFTPTDGDFFDFLTADQLVIEGAVTFDLPPIDGVMFSHELLTLFDPVYGRDRDVFRMSVNAVPEPNALSWLLLLTTYLVSRRSPYRSSQHYSNRAENEPT